MKNFDDVDFVNSYLEKSKIIKMFNSNVGLEGGLVILFEKNNIQGLYIMGYTELGNWVYYFKHGKNAYVEDFEYYSEKYNKIENMCGFTFLEPMDDAW